MKKYILFIWIWVGLCFVGHSQGLKHWFSQKQTQTEYLIQQIAALKVYTGYLEKGYKIVQGGLKTIGDIKEGHFKLDQAFFDGLKMINPKVRNYSRVSEIVSLNIKVVKLSEKAIKSARSSELFSMDELEYVLGVFNKTVDGCFELSGELIQLLTAGELQLSDDERIKRIDAVYAEMDRRSLFVNQFYGELQLLQLQRNKELLDAKKVKKMYGQ